MRLQFLLRFLVRFFSDGCEQCEQISSRSEHIQLGPAGGMTSDRSEQFSSRSHVNICYKNYYDRNEIASERFRSV